MCGRQMRDPGLSWEREKSIDRTDYTSNKEALRIQNPRLWLYNLEAE